MAHVLLLAKLVIMVALGAAFVTMDARVGAVEARPTCKPVGTMKSTLENKFSEVRAATGIVNHNHVMELWASKTGSWSVLITNTNGITCMIASGQSLAVTPKQKNAETH